MGTVPICNFAKLRLPQEPQRQRAQREKRCTLMDHSQFPPGRRRWSLPTDAHEAARRAGGRRGYNATRAFRASVRRQQVIRLLLTHGFDYGSQRRAASALGVSAVTISRDVRALRVWWLGQGGVIWPADLRTPKAAGRVIERIAGNSRR